MSVFEDQGYEGAKLASMGRQLQPCKRDYEGDIKRYREAVKSAVDFRDALYKYLMENGASSNAKPFTLGELIGRLELEIRAGDKYIAQLIAEQEQEQ